MAVVQESALRRMAPAVSLSQAENSCTRRFDPDRPIHSFHSHSDRQSAHSGKLIDRDYSQ